MTDTPRHSVSVAGVVVDSEDRVLVIQRRDNGHWEPPGGVLELDETPEEGAKREVFEETGVEIEIEQLSGIYKNMPRGILALVFRAHPVGGNEVTSDESRSVRWATLGEIIDTMSPAYAVRIEDAYLTGVYLRAHDGENILDRTSD